MFVSGYSGDKRCLTEYRDSLVVKVYPYCPSFYFSRARRLLGEIHTQRSIRWNLHLFNVILCVSSAEKEHNGHKQNGRSIMWMYLVTFLPASVVFLPTPHLLAFSTV